MYKIYFTQIHYDLFSNLLFTYYQVKVTILDFAIMKYLIFYSNNSSNFYKLNQNHNNFKNHIII